MSKSWYKSKTIIFNTLMGILAAIEMADLSFLPDGYGPAVVLAASIGNIILRNVTNTAIGPE